MPSFSLKSKSRLETCHPDLQSLFNEVIKHIDCSILEGHRSKERQNQFYAEGKSKIKWPNGKHNTNPSLAIDVVPYPIDWTDRDRFHFFAGLVKGIASQMKITIRWGGDWDNDADFKDNNFDDFPHFELLNKE